jgi:hypothetical protein
MPETVSVPPAPYGALAGYDVAKLVVLTGFGSPVVDLEAIRALAPSDPRVALLAARRLLFTLDRSANPNDVYTALPQLPASLSTFLGMSQEWVNLALKPGVQLALCEAVPNGRPKQRALFGHGEQSFYMTDPLGGVGYPGHYRSFLTYFVRILLAVYEPYSVSDFNANVSPDAHGFAWVWDRFREIWTQCDLGASSSIQFLLLFCGSVRNWLTASNSITEVGNPEALHMCGDERTPRNPDGSWHRPSETIECLPQVERIVGGVAPPPSAHLWRGHLEECRVHRGLLGLRLVHD